MREIRFRAWDISKKAYHYPKLWDNTMPSNWEQHYILEQYTGLKDKNGVDVFECDYLILSGSFGNLMQSSQKPALYEVKHEGCDYILKRTDLSFNWGSLSRVEELAWQLEVIGNIHTNKDLL